MDHTRNHYGRLVAVNTWIKHIAACPSFRQGWLDAAAGKAWSDYDSANYERGRLFYVWYNTQSYPRATWRRGVMARTVQDRLKTAVLQRAVL